MIDKVVAVHKGDPNISLDSNNTIRELWRTELKGHLISQKDDPCVVRLLHFTDDYYPGGDAA